MCISKISRRLVVAIFAVLIISFIFINFLIAFNSLSTYSSIFSKLIYIVALIAFICIYVFGKEKLSKKKVGKSISLTYRYIYLISITIIVKVISVYNIIPNVTKCEIMLYTVISILSAISLKKIIYNISKSDLLSVCAMLMYSLLPNIVVDKTIYFNMICVTFFVLLVIQFIQKLIDELKQLGIKTSKYMILSVITGVFIGCSILFNINSLIWIILAVILIFIISNLDKTHINFSNKMINTLRQKSKEMLYSLERIYIPKIIISVFIISYFSYLTYILL
ncbi:MAG: hypothetical protein RR144_06185, partial [Clostridia bacterium]